MTEPIIPPRRPGGRLTSRPLHFIWLADVSGSMRVEGRIKALNRAIRATIPHMETVARQNPHASVFVKAICFAEEARWVGERLTPLSEFAWEDAQAEGVTALGEALTMVGDALQAPLMTDYALPPIIVLITDGLPTDDFQAGLNHLLSKPWGKESIRLVVAIGDDANSHDAQQTFRAFMGNDALLPVQAASGEALVEAIRLVSTTALRAVASPTGPISEVISPIAEALAASLLSLEPSPDDLEAGSPDEAEVW